MQRKWVYRVGIIVILFAVLKMPISYLIFGVTAKGRVVGNIFEHSGISILPSSSYPQIEFKYLNQTYTALGEENDYFLVGDEVKVIFFKDDPSKVKIKSFGGLFVDSIIQLPIGLLIWWAFFKSYPKMFTTPRELF